MWWILSAVYFACAAAYTVRPTQFDVIVSDTCGLLLRGAGLPYRLFFFSEYRQ